MLLGYFDASDQGKHHSYNLCMWRDELKAVLHQVCAVDPHQTLVVGFSGGPDSLALLHALRAVDQPLIAAHLDHALRPESAEEAEQAGQVAAGFGVPFFSERVDVAASAEERGLSVEEAARELRYGFLFRVAGQYGAPAVAVAHTADDQVETVLMHLLRGAGPAGLRGMASRLLPNPWSKQIALVRPLLRTWRQEILDYCAAHGLQPVQDPSNQDSTFFRNRLRQELIPQVESLSPGFRRRLWQSADLLAADYEVLTSLAEEAWRRCLARRGEEYLELARSSFMAEPLSLQRAILRRALAELRPLQRDVDFGNVQRALDLILSPETTASADWLAGLHVLIEEDSVWIADWAATLPAGWPQSPERAVHLEIPLELALNAGWRLQAQEVSQAGNGAWETDSTFQARLDLNKVGEELVLRRPRPGDRFQPLGLEHGSLKLSDFFINEKLPRRARAAWPLLCRGEEIVWVPGYRLAHPYRLRMDSRRVLQLRLEKSSD